MEAWERGEKIEYNGGFVWVDVAYLANPDEPMWNWAHVDYRIAKEPKIPDSIGWSHVSQEYRWMARTANNYAYIFAKEPRVIVSDGGWHSTGGAVTSALPFASYRQGNLPWDKSLVQRPEGV